MLLWLAALVPGLAAELDLEDARIRADEQAVAVEIARAETEAAEARARAAVGQSLPELTAFADVTLGRGYTPFGFERPIPWQAGAGVRGSWALLHPTRWSAARAARRTARGQAALLDWTRAQARRDVTSAYAEVQAATRVAEGLTRSAEDARQAADAVSELVAAGLRPPADASRARADAEDLAAQAAVASGERVAACARLQAVLVQTIDGDCAVRPVAWVDQEPGTADGTHPAIEAATQAALAARSQSSAATWTHLPSLTANGTAAEYVVPERSGPGWSATLSIGVPLTWPTRGAAEITAAQADALRASLQRTRARQDLEVSRVSAEARWQAARRTLAARQSGLRAATDAWERVDARFTQGLVDLTTWLDARRSRVDAELSLARAQADLGIALAELELARGVR